MADDLSQADLSRIPVNKMTAAEKAEIKRRFEAFVDNFVPKTANPQIRSAPRVRKWVPGMKR